MPNWCMNSVTVKGDKESVDKFESFLISKDGKDWFDFFAPKPDDLGDGEWYNWNLENFGCKWNCDAQDWDREGNAISFWFDSPWSPPIELYHKIVEQGLEVEAEYCEEGIGFVGEFVNGIDECYDYSDLDDLDDIPEHLVDRWNLRDNMEERMENEDEDEQG